VADDRVAAAVAELYGADPDAFTERRKALAAAAREAGDRGAATAIAALRKPTRAAWLVNRLARSDPGAPAGLAALAADLRAAEQAKDGPRLRELSAERGRLLDALTAQALAAMGTPDPPPSLRAEVTATLTAAMADPDIAAGFAAGTLTKAAEWSGFGYAGFPAADGFAGDSEAVRPGSPAAEPDESDRSPTDGPAASGGSRSAARHRRVARATGTTDAADSPGTARAAGPRAPRKRAADRTAPSGTSAVPIPIRLPEQTDRASQTGRTGQADRAAAQRAAREQEREQRRQTQEARRQAEEEQRRAREAAERAARARQKIDDLERSVAQTSATAAEAAAVEDGLEAEVRHLEERLTQAREELAAARLRARRAEAAERRARQALDRQPPP